jgi:hypothetical protein
MQESRKGAVKTERKNPAAPFPSFSNINRPEAFPQVAAKHLEMPEG